MMIISVTGLRAKGFISWLRFWRLSVPAYRQAKQAKGNLYLAVRRVDGVEHTLTAWKDRKHMTHYVLSGAHRKAMGQFAQIATGATVTFESDEVPSWDEALAKWHEASSASAAP